MTDPRARRPARRRSPHRLQRLRPHRRQPARRPPPPGLQSATAAAGRAPARSRWPAVATGLIGDPGGKSEERTALCRRAAARPTWRASTRQLERFMDFEATGRGRPRALMVDNAEWLGSLPLFEFLRDVGKHFTVNQMMAKESVRSPGWHAPSRASPTPSSATCSCRPTTSSTCSTHSAAGSSSGGATSGGTSPWAST